MADILLDAEAKLGQWLLSEVYIAKNLYTTIITRVIIVLNTTLMTDLYTIKNNKILAEQIAKKFGCRSYIFEIGGKNKNFS
jgi:hypothetical protein